MAGVEDLDPDLIDLMALEEDDGAGYGARAPSVERRDDRHPRLRQIAYLRNVGLISTAEFEAEKARIFSERDD